MTETGTVRIPTKGNSTKIVHYTVEADETPNPTKGLKGGKITKLLLTLDDEEIYYYESGRTEFKDSEITWLALASITSEMN